MGGGGGPKNITQNTKSDPWEGQQPVLRELYKQIQPYISGGGDMSWARTAPWIDNLLPVSPDFDEATQRMRDVGSSLYTNPREGLDPGIQAQMQSLIGAGGDAPGQLFQAGSGLLGGFSPEKKTIRELTGKTRQEWLNPQNDPYTQNLMKAATRPVMASLKDELVGLGSRASMQGAMGGSRQALLEAKALKGAGRQMGDIRAGILMDAARRGESAIAGGKQTQLMDQAQQREHGLRRISTGLDLFKGGAQAGTLQGNLITTLQSMMNAGQDRQLNDILRGIDLTGAAGDRETGREREQLAEQNRRFQEWGYGPLDYLTRVSGIIQGMPSFGSTSTSGPNPNYREPNRLAGGIGGALGGATLASMLGGGAGAAGGAAAGASAGSAVPGWGTVAGLVLGGLLGAFA